MTGRSDDEMVAYALEIDPALLAFAPELLADLDVLGADASMIVEALGTVGIAEQSTVIDLGCGKVGSRLPSPRRWAAGSSASTCSSHSSTWPEQPRRLQGSGSSAFPECRHRRLGGTTEPADAVLYAAFGDALGPLDVTMTAIRRYAKPGGFVVVNDSYLREPTTAVFPGFENYTDLSGTRQRLTACGDELILELLEPDNEDTADTGEAELLAARAAASRPVIPISRPRSRTSHVRSGTSTTTSTGTRAAPSGWFADADGEHSSGRHGSPGVVRYLTPAVTAVLRDSATVLRGFRRLPATHRSVRATNRSRCGSGD